MDLLKKKFLQWHSGVENKIPCHFCSVKLSDEIYSCDFGHDVCQSCKTDSCIACKKSSSFFRNHIAEFLVLKLNTLKSDVESLDDSVIAEKKSECKSQCSQTKIESKSQFSQTKIESKSKFCQTQNEHDNKSLLAAKNVGESVECIVNKSVDVEKSAEDEPKNKNDNPSNTFGIFQCWIGRDCYLKGDHAAILAHIKNQHSEVFVTQPFKGWPHVVTWDLNYNGANTREDRAFEIQGVGLFVLHIFATNEQHLKAHVLMFDSGRTAAQYRYEMEIKSDDKKKSFSAAVDSSRLPRKTLHDRNKGLFMNENSMLQSIIKMKMKYNCTVQITKIIETACDKKMTENPVDSDVKDTAKKYHQNLKPLNKKQFKQTRRSANYLKEKSKPGLLDLKNVKIANCSSETTPAIKNNPFRAPGNNSPLYPDLQKEFNYQQQMKHQHPHMMNNHFNMNMQPPPIDVPFYPHPPPFNNEHYQQNAPPQNAFVHHSDGVSHQAFVPSPPSAPHVDVEGSRNSDQSNKPGNFTAAELDRQKFIQREIEEREKNRLLRSGATTLNTTKEEKRNHNAGFNSREKKSNECVLS